MTMKEIRRTLAAVHESHIEIETGSFPLIDIKFTVYETELDIKYLDSIKGRRVRINIEEVEE